MKLTVITSYYKRFENLKLWLKNIIKNKDIEFIIEEGQENKMFSTAICHNRAVKKSTGKWILKQDIDCYVDKDFYIRLINHLKDKDDDYFMVIPAKGYKKGGGTQWVCLRKKYIEVGGEPEFDGYYGEDYVLIYKLYRLLNNKLKFNENNCGEILSDLSKKKNNEALKQGFFMKHNSINSNYEKGYFKNASKNYDRMYNLCRQI